MTALPIDLALAVAAAGVDINLADEQLEHALRGAIADRSGYLDGPLVGDAGFTVELLSPERMTFAGRTEELALAWCLIYLMGERGEIGTVSLR
jgi:hypothetical protein